MIPGIWPRWVQRNISIALNHPSSSVPPSVLVQVIILCPCLDCCLSFTVLGSAFVFLIINIQMCSSLLLNQYRPVVHNLFRPRATNRFLNPFGGQTRGLYQLVTNECLSKFRKMMFTVT